MRRLLVAALAVSIAATSFAPIAAASSPTVASISTVRALTDAEDAIPSVEEVRAALTIFGAPRINDHDLPDEDPLWDLFDEAGRFVVVPAGEMNEVTFVVGAYEIDAGTSESQDFAATLDLLKTYAQKRVGSAGAVEVRAQSGEDLFGANEAYDVSMIQPEGGALKNVMLVRLSRFGKYVTFVSADTNPKAGQPTDALMMNLALPWLTIAKLVSDKSK